MGVKLPAFEVGKGYDSGRVRLNDQTLKVLRDEANPSNAKKRLNGNYDLFHGDSKTTVTPEGSQTASPALDRYSVHAAMSINGYHPHFQYEKDAEGNMLEVETQGTGKHEGRVFKNPHIHKLVPDQLKEVEDFSSKLVGEREAIETFLRYCSTHQATFLCGHNITTFDIPFLKHRMQYHGIEGGLPEKSFDTLYYARQVLVPALQSLDALADSLSTSEAGKEQVAAVRKVLAGLRKEDGYVSGKLQDLAGAFKVQGDIAHDAMEDVRSNIRVLKSMNDFLHNFRDALESEPVKSYFEARKTEALANQLMGDARGQQDVYDEKARDEVNKELMRKNKWMSKEEILADARKRVHPEPLKTRQGEHL